MEKLKTPEKTGEAERTLADEIKFERAKQALFDEVDAYPNGTVFLTSEGSPAFPNTLERCFRNRSPVVIVFPDGGEVLAMPARTRIISMLRRLLSRVERDGNVAAPTGLLSVPFPADYVVELREPVQDS